MSEDRSYAYRIGMIIFLKLGLSDPFYIIRLRLGRETGERKSEWGMNKKLLGLKFN